MDQIFQLAGAVLILVAFAALQQGRMRPGQPAYLILNLVGSGLLTVAALMDFDWGFLLLEVVWAAFSAWGLFQLARGREPGVAH